jgi:hypothetical protein
VPDLVDACLDLLLDGATGLWHLANQGSVSWIELARMAADRAGLDAARIVTRKPEASKGIAPRPVYSVLGSERGLLLPTLESGLGRYFAEVDHRPCTPVRQPVALARPAPAKSVAERAGAAYEAFHRYNLPALHCVR